MGTRVVKLCITPDQFVQNIILPEKDEMWRHLLQKNFQNRIVRDPSRLAKCQTRRNNGTKEGSSSGRKSSASNEGDMFEEPIGLENKDPSEKEKAVGDMKYLLVKKKQQTICLDTQAFVQFPKLQMKTR